MMVSASVRARIVLLDWGDAKQGYRPAAPEAWLTTSTPGEGRVPCCTMAAISE
jgi:hypothetical protein